ncbi:MAG: hypothetical protein FWD57_05715 [Polyangiaceae bacterium]|nr:hypothetical protein [Polyangiaceae bacterium]
MSEAETEKPKKKSLKDFAQRVSMIPPSEAKPQGAPSQAAPTPASPSQAPPPSVNVPMAAPPPAFGATVAAAPLASSVAPPSFRSSTAAFDNMSEDEDGDSGIVDLNAIRDASQAVAARPAQAAAPVPAPAPPPPEEKKSSMLPLIGGGIVAVVAIAAAVYFVVSRPGQPAADTTPAASIVDPSAQPAATASVAAPELDPSAAADAGTDPDALAAQGDAAGDGSTEPGAIAAGHGSVDGQPATSASASASVAQTAPAGDARPRTGGGSGPAKDPGSLTGAMASAVGVADKTPKEDAPKSTGKTVDPGSIPESPGQGAVTSALAPGRAAAKACIAGDTEPSYATVTFASAGNVTKVAVSGGAQGSQVACVRNAFMGARVGPFKKDSFTTRVTIRP